MENRFDHHEPATLFALRSRRSQEQKYCCIPKTNTQTNGQQDTYQAGRDAYCRKYSISHKCLTGLYFGAIAPHGGKKVQTINQTRGEKLCNLRGRMDRRRTMFPLGIGNITIKRTRVRPNSSAKYHQQTKQETARRTTIQALTAISKTTLPTNRTSRFVPQPWHNGCACMRSPQSVTSVRMGICVKAQLSTTNRKDLNRLPDCRAGYAHHLNTKKIRKQNEYARGNSFFHP